MKPQFQRWDDCDTSETAQRSPGSFGVELPQESQSCGHFFFRSFLVIVIAKVNVSS